MKRTTLYEVNYIEAGYNGATQRWFESQSEAQELANKIWHRGGGADITKHNYGAERAAKIMAEQKERDELNKYLF